MITSEKIEKMEYDLKEKEKDLAVLINAKYDDPYNEKIQEEIEILERSTYRLEKEIEKAKMEKHYGKDVVLKKEEKMKEFKKRVKEELPYVSIENIHYEGDILSSVTCSFFYTDNNGNTKEMFNETFQCLSLDNEEHCYGFSPSYFRDQNDFINKMKDYRYAFDLINDKLIKKYGINPEKIKFDSIHLDWDRSDILFYSFFQDSKLQHARYIYNESEQENLFLLNSFFTDEIRGVIRNKYDGEGNKEFTIGTVLLEEFLEDGFEVEIKIISRKAK